MVLLSYLGRLTFRLLSDPKILTVALANGSIEVYALKLNDHDPPSLQRVNSIQYFEESSLVLSLAASPSTPLLGTLSTGELSTLDVQSETKDPISRWKAHDLEVWCGAWKSPETILSGGDDALLKVWDLRALSTPQASNKRYSPFCIRDAKSSHGAGVTSILPATETLFLTGSYDNTLRSFDYRNLRAPISSINLDGGVWRILPRPGNNSTSFLVCCMQEGSRTVTLSQNGEFSLDGTFEPQEERRLFYGGSWQSENIAALCSFYEMKLYIVGIP
jgi:diphthine methyl ester acylhydrolase